MYINKSRFRAAAVVLQIVPVCHWLQTTTGVGDAARPDDVTAKKPEPEVDSPRQRLLDRSGAENDTTRFVVHDNGVATMTYVVRLPDALSRWTVAISLSPADWTPSSDCQLIHAAQRMLQQLQADIDQLTTADQHPDSQPQDTGTEVDQPVVGSLQLTVQSCYLTYLPTYLLT